MDQTRRIVMRALAHLRFAIKLEKDAIKRYEDHIAKIENPAVNALLEGILRNEERHLRILNKKMKLFKKNELEREM